MEKVVFELLKNDIVRKFRKNNKKDEKSVDFHLFVC